MNDEINITIIKNKFLSKKENEKKPVTIWLRVCGLGILRRIAL